MKNNMIILRSLIFAMFLFASGLVSAQQVAECDKMSAAECALMANCPKKGTADCPMVHSASLASADAKALADCPKKGTADCPLIKNCPKKGTADCPYAKTSDRSLASNSVKAAAELPSCCKKVNQ